MRTELIVMADTVGGMRRNAKATDGFLDLGVDRRRDGFLLSSTSLFSPENALVPGFVYVWTKPDEWFEWL